ncbi:hypothetical protein L2E82_04311 [Cichorium intybus]|uniref:Uncharacterized protein n=1 Tax=Cichorium intybus TaxID=13427 RepID=A0ACB9H589_CICIN|nr:hypothetical protein L2E82_04311 [Cichorium intybus]
MASTTLIILSFLVPLVFSGNIQATVARHLSHISGPPGLPSTVRPFPRPGPPEKSRHLCQHSQCDSRDSLIFYPASQTSRFSSVSPPPRRSSHDQSVSPPLGSSSNYQSVPLPPRHLSAYQSVSPPPRRSFHVWSVPRAATPPLTRLVTPLVAGIIRD